MSSKKFQLAEFHPSADPRERTRQLQLHESHVCLGGTGEMIINTYAVLSKVRAVLLRFRYFDGCEKLNEFSPVFIFTSPHIINISAL